jgi:hypothetical protein
MSAVLISGAELRDPRWRTGSRWGFEPTLIERAPALRTGGYVVDFWGLGYDIAERMGLISEINCIGYHVQECELARHLTPDRRPRLTLSDVTQASA